MPIPASATVFPQTVDPSDVVEFKLTLTRGATVDVPFPLLDASESVVTFALTLPAESIAAGLILVSGAFRGATYPAPTLVGLDLTFWVAIDASLQGSAIFNGTGVSLPVELTINTNASPPRTKQRTLVIKAAHQ